MSASTDHVFVLPHTDSHELGDHLALLRLTDGELAIRHRCKEVGPGEHLVCSPRLNHEVSGDWPALTVTPSILCPDCGLHGFVTDGCWRPA